MSTRPAYELKKPIQFYNLVQILLSAYLFYECGVSGWFSHYNWLCQDIELDQNGLRMAKVSYMYYMSKFLELQKDMRDLMTPFETLPLRRTQATWIKN